LAITLDELKALATGDGLEYVAATDRPTLIVSFAGKTGSRQFSITIDQDGRFFQLRTIDFDHCTAGNPNLQVVLRAICEMDFVLRLTKFGWDPADGEVMAYLDVWLGDAKPSRDQFNAWVSNFTNAIDMGHDRLHRTMETGIDPRGFGCMDYRTEQGHDPNLVHKPLSAAPTPVPAPTSSPVPTTEAPAPTPQPVPDDTSLGPDRI
jgi:hypothetical protein